MLEHQFLKLLLGKEFWLKNQQYITPELFPGQLKIIYNTIEYAHTNIDTPFTANDLLKLCFAIHPALNSAAKSNVARLLEEVGEIDAINPEIAQDILRRMLRKEQARKIAEAAIEVIDGRQEDFLGISKLLTEHKEDDTEFQETTTDIDELLELNTLTTKWKFNLAPLAEVIPGCGPGNQLIFFARPEVGKTATCYFCYGRGGFCEQGARVLHIGNEEPLYRTVLRAISSHTEMLLSEISSNRARARELFQPIRKNIIPIYDTNLTVQALEQLVKRYKPDILWIDQQDKLKIAGEYAREDLRLKEIYIRTRHLAAEYDLISVALSQASAEAEGQRILRLDWLDNSKTGKAAEGDLVIGIGAQPQNDRMDPIETRWMTLCKNKINGRSGVTITCRLDHGRTIYQS